MNIEELNKRKGAVVINQRGEILEGVRIVSIGELKQAHRNMEVIKVIDLLKTNIAKTYYGEEKDVNNIIIALLCGGHVLIEGVPGIGKTTLAIALAKSIDMTFKRIQFTPDTTPSDITGSNLFNPKEGEFKFIEGPIFANVVIADEINRTNPKVQSGLLEAMAEHQVSIDGTVYHLPEPFFVVATQNPIEQFGTYELPEAQLDRFFMKLTVDYLPNDLEEELVLNAVQLRKAKRDVVEEIIPVEQIIELQREVENVIVSQEMITYVMDIVRATRKHPNVSTGISTRSAMALVDGAKAHALVNGRDFILADDVKAVIYPMFNHKIVLNDEAKLDSISTFSVIDQVLQQVKVPN